MRWAELKKKIHLLGNKHGNTTEHFTWIASHMRMWPQKKWNEILLWYRINALFLRLFDPSLGYSCCNWRHVKAAETKEEKLVSRSYLLRNWSRAHSGPSWSLWHPGPPEEALQPSKHVCRAKGSSARPSARNCGDTRCRMFWGQMS